jgi:hypothetical protein
VLQVPSSTIIRLTTSICSVDKVEVEPVIRYNNPLDHLDEEDDDNAESTTVVSLQNGGQVLLQNGGHHSNGHSAICVQNGDHVLQQNGGHHNNVENGHSAICAQNGGAQQNGHVVAENGATEEEEADEEPPVNIITGPDWESVNYTVTKVIN